MTRRDKLREVRIYTMAERDKEKPKHALELYIQLIPTLNTGLCEHNPQAGSGIEQSI